MHGKRKLNKTHQLQNDKYGNMLHYVRTNFNSILDKNKQRLFSPDDAKRNDVYSRLFKDSKIKQIQNNEFTEFLKLKQSVGVNQTISARFMNKSMDISKKSDFTVRNHKSRVYYDKNCL